MSNRDDDAPLGYSRRDGENSIIIEMGGVEAWDYFVKHNRDALVEQCGTVDAARTIAKTPEGLMLGGGAGVPVFVWLTE